MAVDIGSEVLVLSLFTSFLMSVVVGSLCCNCRVPVDFVLLFRNVIPDITVLGRSFVFSQSCLHFSASLPNISLPVSTLDYVHRSLSIVRLIFVLDVGQYLSDWFVGYTDVVRL